MSLQASTQDLVFAQMMRVAAAASLAALLARFAAFRRAVFAEHRTPSLNLQLMLMLALPFALGVALGLKKGYGFADMTLEGALLIGLVGGRVPGVLGGAILSLPAYIHHEWLAVPVAALAGLAGGLVREIVPSSEAIWDFGPFTFLGVPRRLWGLIVRREPAWQLLPLSACVALALGRLVLERTVPAGWFNFQPTGAWLATLDVFVAIFAVSLPIKIWNSVRLEVNLEENQRLLLKARMDALASQINPHFLFNTLNTVSALVRFDPDRAREVVLKLSSILRRLLRQHETFVPLREEMEFIDDYIDIEVARFGPDKLQFFPEVETDTLDCFVPSMLLQPIVENAIKHGLTPKLEGGEIRLRTRRLNGRLVIEVEDNGTGIPEHRHPRVYTGGIGFRNVRERLHLLYGNDFDLQIDSRVGEGTRIRVDIPELMPTISRNVKTVVGD